MLWSPVLHVVGILLSTMGLSMIVPLIIDLVDGNDDWRVFLLCIFLTLFVGGIITVLTKSDHKDISPKQGFLLITLSWLTLCLFAALPIWLCSINISFTDAIFEATSGLTTTGSTVLLELQTLPRGILIWRSILQWLGGVGIILMALSIMPFLKIGGMQLFQTELSEGEKALPRTADLAKTIGLIYLLLTALCTIAYMGSGLTLFDAAAHAMTTISTAGFSTYDDSIAHFNSTHTELVSTLFMIAGGIPFILFIKLMKGRSVPMLQDSQVRWFLSLVVIATVALYFISDATLSEATTFDTIVDIMFSVVAVITGTGYAVADYGSWGTFSVCFFFFLMAAGACAGSTSCGIKMFRFKIMQSVINVQLKKLIYPNGVFVPRYNSKPLPEGVAASVLVFFFLYGISFAALSMALALTGLDNITALSGAMTSISNVGPALGDIIGPVGNFNPLPDTSKWILVVGMLLGRLEIYPLLILFSPIFWRK